MTEYRRTKVEISSAWRVPLIALWRTSVTMHRFKLKSEPTCIAFETSTGKPTIYVGSAMAV
jgi:hypothetical protein